MADTTVDQEMEQIVSLKLQKAQTEEQIRNVNAELKAKQDKIAETEANIEKRNAEHADLHHNNVQLQEQINEKQAHYDHISTQVSEEADAKMKEAEVALANAQATQVEADAKMEAYTNSVIGAKKKEASLNIVAKQQEVKEKELDEREKTVAKSLEEIELMKQEYAELKAKTSEKTAKTEEWEASLSAREEKLTKRANDVQYREEIVSSREEIVKQGETKLKENIEKARSLFISMEQTKDLLISKFGDKAVPLSEVNAVLDSA